MAPSLPVVDHQRLVGLIGEVDQARHVSEETVGHSVEAVWVNR
jgi:hypothetical protein